MVVAVDGGGYVAGDGSSVVDGSRVTLMVTGVRSGRVDVAVVMMRADDV